MTFFSGVSFVRQRLKENLFFCSKTSLQVPFKTWMAFFLVNISLIECLDDDKKSTFLVSYFHFNILFTRFSRWKVTNLKIVLQKVKTRNKNLDFFWLRKCFVCFDFTEWFRDFLIRGRKELNWRDTTRSRWRSSKKKCDY